MKYLAFFFLSLVTISSCTNPHKAEIKKINKLLLSLDSSKTQLYKIDTGKIYSRIRIIQEKLDYIYANADTLNRTQAFLIDDYSTTKKYYSKGVLRFGVMFTEIETIPMQLKNLRKDLDKNILSKEEASSYLINEELAAESLQASINAVQSRFETLEETFIESHQKILLLIKSIDSTKTDNTLTELY